MNTKQKYAFWVEEAKARYRRWLSLRGEWNECMAWRGYQRALSNAELYREQEREAA